MFDVQDEPDVCIIYYMTISDVPGNKKYVVQFRVL